MRDIPAVRSPPSSSGARSTPPSRGEAAEGCGQYVTGPFRYEVLEGVDHWVPELAADRLNELLLAHLARALGNGPEPTSRVPSEDWVAVGIRWAGGRHWMAKSPMHRAQPHVPMGVRGEPQAQGKNRGL